MSTAVATFRASYSDYIHDVTGSPQTTGRTVHTGIAQLSHPFLQRQNQGVQQNGAMPHYGGGAEKCARCSKSVYLAEKKVGAGRSFHSSCFSCQTCHRKLDATTLSEHKGEIFCKTCYTRQFGVHGLISGVTMTTENPVREVRHSRRSSYGSELDAPVITHQQPRPRAHSNDNTLRGENSAIIHDELPKLFPWRNDVIPEQHSPPTNHGVDHLVERQHSRPKSQIGFETVIPEQRSPPTNHGVDHLVERQHSRPKSQIGLETVVPEQRSPPTNHGVDNLVKKQDSRPKSQIGFEKVIPVTYTEENHSNYDKPTYSNGTTAIINMPFVSPPKRVETSTKNDERSPSPTSRDIYQRKISHERQSDISANFARLTLSEEINNELYVNDNIMTNKIATENPIVKPKYVLSPSQEDKRASSNANHSRDSSPSANTHSHRSPSPTSGYGSSSVHGGISRDSTSSPPSAYVPQHEYLDARSSNNYANDRHPSSPSKTNNLPSPPPIGGKYSTIAALIKPHRPVSQLSTPNDDEYQN